MGKLAEAGAGVGAWLTTAAAGGTDSEVAAAGWSVGVGGVGVASGIAAAAGAETGDGTHPGAGGWWTGDMSGASGRGLDRVRSRRKYFGRQSVRRVDSMYWTTLETEVLCSAAHTRA